MWVHSSKSTANEVPPDAARDFHARRYAISPAASGSLEPARVLMDGSYLDRPFAGGFVGPARRSSNRRCGRRPESSCRVSTPFLIG
jgi:hypothetical protein